MSNVQIPFCKPDFGNLEREAIEDAILSGQLEGGGALTALCMDLISSEVGCDRTLITPSCTAALEMMALALDLKPGDEIIMPSFTFVSTANAFALRGGVPIFVDIDPRTLNIDPNQVEAAISDRTRAIVAVHYAGVGCDMDRLLDICSRFNITLLEDAAQAYGAYWNERPLGSFGVMAAFSFHHTKNITCGEGGALTINDEGFIRRCEIIQDKGTDRSDFLRGIVKKYEWQSLGSSYLLSEVAAAILSAQLKREKTLTRDRLALWNRYHEVFKDRTSIWTPDIPKTAQHNGHIYPICFQNQDQRSACISALREQGIVASPHYVPLHLTPAGQSLGRSYGDMSNTVRVTETLMRLPIYSSMESHQQDVIISALSQYLDQCE